MMTRDRWKQWAFVALLYLPVALFYIAHYSVPQQEPGLLPTGGMSWSGQGEGKCCADQLG